MPRLPCVLVVAAALTAGPAQAQIMSAPVQDYIDKTTLLNNILSNRRAIEGSRRAQPGGGAPVDTAAGTHEAAGGPSVFRPSAEPLLPARLAAQSGDDPAPSERFFASWRRSGARR